MATACWRFCAARNLGRRDPDGLRLQTRADSGQACGPVGGAVEHDLALVQCRHRRPVGDRDDGGVRQPAASARRRALPRPRGRGWRSPRPGTASPGLVSNARAIATPLLLPAGQALRPSSLPRPAAARTVHEPGIGQGGADCRIVVARRIGRIGDGMAQAAQRNIRPLRQEQAAALRPVGARPWPNGQMPASARNSVDLPLPERPVTTTDWPRCNLRSRGRQQGRAVRQLERHVFGAFVACAVRRSATPGPCRKRGRARRDDCAVEGGEPFDVACQEASRGVAE